MTRRGGSPTTSASRASPPGRLITRHGTAPGPGSGAHWAETPVQTRPSTLCLGTSVRGRPQVSGGRPGRDGPIPTGLARRRQAGRIRGALIIGREEGTRPRTTCPCPLAAARVPGPRWRLPPWSRPCSWHCGRGLSGKRTRGILWNGTPWSRPRSPSVPSSVARPERGPRRHQRSRRPWQQSVALPGQCHRLRGPRSARRPVRPDLDSDRCPRRRHLRHRRSAGRSRSSAGGTLAVGVWLLVVMSEAIGWSAHR